MIEHLLHSLREVWHCLEIDHPFPEVPLTVLQRRRRLVMVVFDGKKQVGPLAVVKVNRFPAENAQMERYVRCAQELRRRVDAGVQRTIPPMEILRPYLGCQSVAEKAMPGRPFEISALRVRPNLVEAQCARFADWLVKFHAETSSDKIKIGNETIEVLEERLNGKTPAIHWKDHLQPLQGVELPLVWVYGDAHPSNILYQDGEVSGLVDWEGTIGDQLPVYDWYQFCVSLLLENLKLELPQQTLASRNAIACQKMMTFQDGTLAAILKRRTCEFLRAIDLDFEIHHALFSLFLLDYYVCPDKHLVLQQVFAGGRDG